MSLLAASQTSPVKAQVVAEVRTMRATLFFFMMDLYGNIPVSTTFGDTAKPKQQTREQVFNFIESEVKAVLYR